MCGRVGGDCLLCRLSGVVMWFVLVVVVWKVGGEGGRVRNIGVCSFS